MEPVANTAIAFGLDLVLKASVLLGATALALAAFPRASAAVRQLVAALGLAGALALPAVSLVAPSLELPLFRSPLPERMTFVALSAPAATGEPEFEPVDARGDESIVTREPEGATAGADSSSVAKSSPRAPEGAPGGVAFEPSAPDLPAPAVRSDRPWLSAAGAVLAALALWVGGFLFGLARLAVGTARVRRIRRDSTPPPDDSWSVLVRALCEALGLRRAVDVRFTPNLAVPVTTGLARPVVLLPDVARRWNEERRRVVLLHELAHIQRADWLSLIVGQLAGAVYWFHPFAWFVRATMRKDCERACDDLVLSSGTRASVYAAHLLSIIRSLRLSNQRALPAVAMARRSYWDGRMRAILDPAIRRSRVSRRQARFAAGALVAAVAVLAVLSPWAPNRAEGRMATVGDPELMDLAPAASSDEADSKATQDEDSESDCDSKGDGETQPAVIEEEKSGPEKAASKVQVAVSDMIEALQEAVNPEPEKVEPTGYVPAGRKHKEGAWYSRGMELHNDGRYDEAIRAFQQSIAEGEKVEAATYNVACGYALKGDRDRAFEWLEKAMDAGFDVGHYLESDDDLDALRSDPRYAQFRRAARDKEIEEKKDEAGHLAQKYERLRASNPKSGSGFYELGKELLDVGRYDLSAQAFQAAAARGYKESTSLYNTACALSLAGNRAGALDYLHRSLEAGYDDPQHMRRDADLDNIRGEPRYRELVAMADDLELHRFDDNFGDKFWKRSKQRRQDWINAWREVEQHFADYTRRHPQSGRGWFNLGYARIEGERPAEAAEAFRRALDLGYRKPTTMYNIACAYSLQDRRDEAFDWLFKAMDAGFEGKGLLRGDDDLDNLRGDPRFRQALSRAKEDWDGDDD